MADKEEKAREKEAKNYAKKMKKEMEKKAKKKKKKLALKKQREKRHLYKYLSNIQEERDITARLIQTERERQKKLATGATIQYPCKCSFACNYLPIVRNMKKSYKNLYSSYHKLFDQYLHLYFLELPNYDEDTEEDEELYPEVPTWRNILDNFFSVVFFPLTAVRWIKKACRKWIMQRFWRYGPATEENVSNVLQLPNEADLQDTEETATPQQKPDMNIYGNLIVDWDICFGKKDENVVNYYRQLGKMYCEMQKISKAEKVFNAVMQFLYLEKTCICIHCGAMTDCELYSAATNELYQEYCDVYCDYLALWFATKVDFGSDNTRTLDVHAKYNELQEEVEINKNQYAWN